MGLERRVRSRRGLLVVLLVLVAFLVMVDLAGPHSIVRGYLHDMGARPNTPLGRFLDEITP